MKKLFLGAMALLAAVTLVACGSKKDAYESIKENKKLVRCRIIEKSFIVIVFIMDYIRTILRIRLTCLMVYDTETFSTFYYKLEINMLIMALAFTLR